MKGNVLNGICTRCRLPTNTANPTNVAARDADVLGGDLFSDLSRELPEDRVNLGFQVTARLLKVCDHPSNKGRRPTPHESDLLAPTGGWPVR